FSGCQLSAAHGGGGGWGNVLIGNPGQIGAVRINAQFYSRALRVPIITRARGIGEAAEEIFQLARQPPQGADVFLRLRSTDIGVVRNQNVDGEIDGRILQLANVDANAGDSLGENGLHILHELGGDFLVFHLENDLCVVQLLQLRRNGEPETGTAAAYKRRHIPQKAFRLPTFVGVLLREVFRLSAN